MTEEFEVYRYIVCWKEPIGFDWEWKHKDFANKKEAKLFARKKRNRKHYYRDVRVETCPLQFLADYTKQVRKEVLDIIDKKFNCCGYIEEKFEDIKKYVLDQIQGENNVKG